MTDAISRSAVLEILSNEFDMAAEERADADNEKDRAFNAGEINCARRSTRKVKELPALDVVPVVRCKDCRYSEPMKKHGVCKFGENALNCTQYRGDDGYGYAGISVIYPDDYCSDGAPKDGEADA